MNGVCVLQFVFPLQPGPEGDQFIPSIVRLGGIHQGDFCGAKENPLPDSTFASVIFGRSESLVVVAEVDKMT